MPCSWVYGCIFLSFYSKRNKSKNTTLTSKQWEKTLDLRNQLIEIEELNRKLQKELNQKQDKGT